MPHCRYWNATADTMAGLIGRIAALLLLPGLTLASDIPLESASATQDVAQVARDAINSGIAATGKFEFVVRNTGRDGRQLYLNSEADYRSPSCLTIVVRRGLWSKVGALVGGDAEDFVGQRIRVTGKVTREKIYFLDQTDERTRRYYHQAHLKLGSADDIELLAGD